MEETADGQAVRNAVRRVRCESGTIGLVPTMGYLHEGHLALAHEARRENDLVVMSIFVNPTQFGPAEDFGRYPRDLDRDRRLAAQAGVDVLFLPEVREMYPDGPERQSVWVDPGPLAEHLDGASRPGHFRGVATVVAKLFAKVQPDRAYFGQKDGQQAAVVTRMARDLGFPLEVRVVSTVREDDGLALSSRNVYLSAEQRAQAPALHRALERAATLVRHGERDAQAIEAAVSEVIAVEAPDARMEFVTVADLTSMQPVEGTISGDIMLALAAHFGKTRLIDNVVVRLADDTAGAGTVTRPGTTALLGRSLWHEG